MRKNLIVILLICWGILTGCTPGSAVQIIAQVPLQNQPQTVTVFAAASLTESFSEIAEKFEAKNPGITIRFNFAGSQQLAQQLLHGAPADIFASANQNQMQIIVEAGLIDSQAHKPVRTFAANHLVIIYPADNPAQLHELTDLSRPGLKLVIADRAVPVGYYTEIFLENAQQEPTLGPNFKNSIFRNVVSYENSVRAVLSKVILGEADAGIVYSSDLSASREQPIGQLPIPDQLNPTASYYITPLHDSKHNQAAQAFINYVMSANGQAILSKYGFLPVR